MDSPPRKKAAPSSTDGGEAVVAELPNELSTPIRANRNVTNSVDVDSAVATPTMSTTEVEIVEEGDHSTKSSSSAPNIRNNFSSRNNSITLTDKAAPVLAKLSSWSKQANANAKDFWSKRAAGSGGVGVSSSIFSTESFKSRVSTLTSASLETSTPMNSDKEKEVAETKEAETSPPTPPPAAAAAAPASSSLPKESLAATTANEPGAQAPETPEQTGHSMIMPIAKIIPALATPPPPLSRTFSSAGNKTSGASLFNAATNDINLINNDSWMDPIPLRTVETAPANLFSGRSSLLGPSLTSTSTPARGGGDQDGDNSSFYSQDDEETASSYWSSTYSTSDANSGAGGASGSSIMRGTLKWAAASVVDSMQQTYRGRYNRSSPDNFPDLSSPSPNQYHHSAYLSRTHSLEATSALSTSSQTHRILQSRAKHHLQDLMESLEPHEYIMLLGHGMLGVNLKSTYLKDGGVYVDYLVRDGAAEKSGVIRPGDSLCYIGELDVRRGNILQVPNQIAQAKRPVHLVFATGSATAEGVNYLDIATALLHDQVDGRPSVVRFEETAVASSPMKLVQPTNVETNNITESGNGDVAAANNDLVIPKMDPSCEGFLRPAIPLLEIRKAFLGRAAQRCNETYFRADRIWTSASTDTNLVHALRHAFALTTADVRRLPFLVRQWSEQDDVTAAVAAAQQQHDRQLSSSSQESQITNSPNAMLMLYLEIFQFVDLFGVTPVARRREIAQKIANKFFLPISIGDNELMPPMLDFHHIVSDSALRALEAALKDKSTPVTVDLFADFQQAVIEALTGQHFLTFLVSDECSRMRAYMRNTAPFLNLPLDQVIGTIVRNDPTDDRIAHAKNYLLHIIVYLLTQTEPEEVGETNGIVDSGSRDKQPRVADSAANLCAALYIQNKLFKAIETIEERKHPDTTRALFESFEHFWEKFLSPTVGSLEITSLSADTRAKVKMVRMELEQIGAPCRHAASLKYDDESTILTTEVTTAQLTDPQLVENLESLAESLLYDYAVIDHSKFRAHKIHEWMCQEAAKGNNNKAAESLAPPTIPSLLPNCVKRLLRKVSLPQSVSVHKPFNSSTTTTSVASGRKRAPKECTAECVVVFGTSMERNTAVQERETVQRYACISLGDAGLLPEQLPPTLEGYAVVPNATYQQPFYNYQNSDSRSIDGWEISLLNFRVPHANSGTDDAEDSALYGVSLVLRRKAIFPGDEENTIPTNVEHSLASHSCIYFSGSTEAGDLKRTVVVQSDCSVFNSRLRENTWRKQHPIGSATVGIALVSCHNAIPSMRQALAKMLSKFSKTGRDGLHCNGLADFLGNFSHPDVETDLLGNFVQPFLDESLKPWMEKPFGTQQAAFEEEAGEQLIRSLPPIPLALLFVTALLEQKIVITGSRRSILLSATTALTEILKPLKWCHLLVPRVPAAFAADLLQYPAPFILGMPAQDPGILELIRELPEDVTLVDLDVGRVILASSFAHNSELCRGTPKNETTARALRTQVLSLAQCLGYVFGSCVDPMCWGIDRISEDCQVQTPYAALKSACRDFVHELLAGATSSCYWIEESSNAGKPTEPTVLFDEDRFFRIKAARHKNPYTPLMKQSPEGTKLALGVDTFGMILEVFLRCQSMNAYIGSCKGGDMLFAL